MGYREDMLGRFTVRPDGNGKGTFGVWDGAVNGWRVTGQDAEDAERHKVELDIRFDAHGPRPANDVRAVDPTQAVERAVAWEPAELETWIRDDGQWCGRIRNRDGQVALVPQADLRPTGQKRS